MLRGFIIGVIVTIVLAFGAIYLGISEGWMPAGADVSPGPIERWAALRSLHAAIERGSANLKSPIPASPENLVAGAKIYEEDCLMCHGAADGRPSEIASGLYLKAPQLGRDGVEDDPPGETYWKVKHGIRFTGMPSFGKALSETELWQVSLFLAHMDKLPPQANQLWHRMPSAGEHETESSPKTPEQTPPAPNPPSGH